MSDLCGICQVCGKTITAYSREAAPLGMYSTASQRVMPARPFRAEPCGHDQPREIVYRGEALTYPVRER